MRLQWLATLALLSAACGTVTPPSRSPTPVGAASTASVTSPTATSSSSLPPGKDYLPPTPFPASAGPYVVDLTWVSNSMGWALAAVPCAGQLCAGGGGDHRRGRHLAASAQPAGVARSDRENAGASGITIAAAQGDCEQDLSCVSQIRFATSRIGYLFGPGPVHDRGRR